jgi:hypothetical protein
MSELLRNEERVEEVNEKEQRHAAHPDDVGHD